MTVYIFLYYILENPTQRGCFTRTLNYVHGNAYRNVLLQTK